MISQALTLEPVMETALKKIDEISLMTSWSARLAVIDVLQVLVFNNMPIVLSKDDWIQKVQFIVLRLLEDPVLEVRVKSAQVLGGLLHCSFLPSTDKLLELFKEKCRTKLMKNTVRRVVTNCRNEAAVATASTNNEIIIDTESVRRRHMGVLGLCAFISAYPYDIPDFVPDVFEHLGAHLNDPQPISVNSRTMQNNFLSLNIFSVFLFTFNFSQPYVKRSVTLNVHIMTIGHHINRNSLKINYLFLVI